MAASVVGFLIEAELLMRLDLHQGAEQNALHVASNITKHLRVIPYAWHFRFAQV
ncbi:hypothetical protein VAE122_140003 [Vibrio aestuarianus]|nr:hypothetical protein VAE122_140003 [Vibrio aestuarianus]